MLWLPAAQICKGRCVRFRHVQSVETVLKIELTRLSNTLQLAMTEELGVTSFWGFSPSMDLLDATLNFNSATDIAKPEAINILLINPADIRHIMHTMAKHDDIFV